MCVLVKLIKVGFFGLIFNRSQKQTLVYKINYVYIILMIQQLEPGHFFVDL